MTSDPKKEPEGQKQQQQQSGEGQPYGEGNYKATRDYERGLKEHIDVSHLRQNLRVPALHRPRGAAFHNRPRDRCNVLCRKLQAKPTESVEVVRCCA